MKRRFVTIAGTALLATDIGFAAAAAGSGPRRAVVQRPAAQAPQKAATIPVVVYKSPT